MKKLALLFVFGSLVAQAGVLKFSAKAASKTVVFAAKSTAKAAKLAFKVAY